MTVPLAFEQTNRTAPDVRPHPGEIVSLSPDPAGIRLYDAMTGAAIQ